MHYLREYSEWDERASKCEAGDPPGGTLLHGDPHQNETNRSIDQHKQVPMPIGEPRVEMLAHGIVGDPLLLAGRKVAQIDEEEAVDHEPD
ncbi:MAG: hypothetical protein ACRCUC_05015 [Aestuariivirga sp.]